MKFDIIDVYRKKKHQHNIPRQKKPLFLLQLNKFCYKDLLTIAQ